MTRAGRKQIERELANAIRACGRAHAKVAALSRRPPSEWRALRAFGRAAERASVAYGRVSGFALLFEAERRRARA